MPLLIKLFIVVCFLCMEYLKHIYRLHNVDNPNVNTFNSTSISMAFTVGIGII